MNQVANNRIINGSIIHSYMYGNATCAHDYAVADALTRGAADSKGSPFHYGTTPKTYAPKQSYMGRSISFSL